MEARNYIVCLLDLEHNRQQNGIFFLSTSAQLHDVAMKLGISPTLCRLIGRRWEIHINEEPHQVELMGCSNTIANIVKRLTEALIAKNEKSIVIPANIPLPPRKDFTKDIVPEVEWDGE